MISVIVPVYNVEKYIENCILSLINQTEKNIEIIIVDDGSTDNSSSICDELEKKYNNIVVIHQKNKGSSGARNTGLEIAKGEFISFVDGDDLVDKSMYHALLQMIVKYKADLAICGCKKTYENEKIESSIYFPEDVKLLDFEESWEEVFGRLNNSSCNKLYKKELIGNLRFMTGIQRGEDLIFNIEYLNRIKNSVITDSMFYNYLTREGSITRTKFNENIFEEIEAKDIAKKLVNEYKPNYSFIANVYAFRARMNVIRALYQTNNEDKYANILEEIKEYINNNFLKIKKGLKIKEKIEFYLYKNFIIIYKYIIKNFID